MGNTNNNKIGFFYSESELLSQSNGPVIPGGGSAINFRVGLLLELLLDEDDDMDIKLIIPGSRGIAGVISNRVTDRFSSSSETAVLLKRGRCCSILRAIMGEQRGDPGSSAFC